MTEKDEIFQKKKEESLPTVSFLKAINKNFDQETAFNVAFEAFTYYMTCLYEGILSSTKEGSQERFDKFREFYEEYAEKTPYCEIEESTPNMLKAKFLRCPFFEVLKEENLEDFGYAFCLSDPAFTEKVLPKVNFTRKHVISKGDSYCDNTWEFKSKE